MFSFAGSCWMCEGEQQEAIERLVSAGLIKWDNKRSLPLKSGGKTDIYINLRQMRSRPYIMKYLGLLYGNALRRLRVDRFVEVPEAVSLLAGVISTETNIPAVTIREEEKEGRVVSGKLIGDLNAGDRVAIIDDVITDGASKVAALNLLAQNGAENAGIVVLCDRQQGWKKKLAAAGFPNTGVWAGFTLHDVRKYLVERKLMQRCDPAVEAKNPIIVALDGKSWDEILPLVDQLRTTGCILKVNDLLFYKGIEWLLPNLSVYGRVMADLKGHDIKNTLENISRHFGACPPWAVTVHASGGAEMVKAVRAKLNEVGASSTKILAVTVLTSLDEKACVDVYGRHPSVVVPSLADLVAEGADGFVCSAVEVETLRRKFPDKELVTPGVRSPGADVNDQARVDTPANAKANGASKQVMGRQILGAKDPVAEVQRVLTEELGVTL
jgi:orotidine-5'-phosphate decarboxylase